jgi:hypothetical protein
MIVKQRLALAWQATSPQRQGVRPSQVTSAVTNGSQEGARVRSGIADKSASPLAGR